MHAVTPKICPANGAKGFAATYTAQRACVAVARYFAGSGAGATAPISSKIW